MDGSFHLRWVSLPLAFCALSCFSASFARAERLPARHAAIFFAFIFRVYVVSFWYCLHFFRFFIYYHQFCSSGFFSIYDTFRWFLASILVLSISSPVFDSATSACRLIFLYFHIFRPILDFRHFPRSAVSHYVPPSTRPALRFSIYYTILIASSPGFDADFSR